MECVLDFVRIMHIILCWQGWTAWHGQTPNNHLQSPVDKFIDHESINYVHSVNSLTSLADSSDGLFSHVFQLFRVMLRWDGPYRFGLGWMV